jgi:hypothetical protein
MLTEHLGGWIQQIGDDLFLTRRAICETTNLMRLNRQIIMCACGSKNRRLIRVYCTTIGFHPQQIYRFVKESTRT